jgi:hypothetical protein
MRKLTRLWQALERIPALVAIPACWEHHCGPDYPVIRSFIRVTEMAGASYPCADCVREIIDYGDGEIVAVCRDKWKQCEDIPLKAADTVLHAVDVPAFSKAIARPLGFRWHNPATRGHAAWSIGLAPDGFGNDRQVILMVHSDQERFRASLHQLLAGVEEPFILLCPTAARKDPGIHEMLVRRRVRFHALEDHLGANAEGLLITIRSLSDGVAAVPVTPVAERAAKVKAFAGKHALTIKEILVALGLDYRDFKRWRKGDLDDSSSKSKRIEHTSP